MSDSYLGEVRLFVGTYAPEGWELCNGQVLKVSNHEALFSLLGATYGGDGRTTFALPDYRGRVPIHMGTSSTGSNFSLKDKGGVETVQLTQAQLPAHTHLAAAQQSAGDETSPTGHFWAASTVKQYSAGTTAPNAAMKQNALSTEGGNLAHNNIMPSMALTYIICTRGTYPTRQY
ncbi:phage tail protein [Paenibacillus sp. BIHB 4019]|uniref:Phage tail protein n=1 Tax=Paenibacillus sp. BIHB 4019 TaxID=1870819 RepID=A0A1B2DGG9_9BACL|nr:tail fiber protein [Paenibacillus sp. BIHB 4019]ANY66810.1 phage tail protein [Paenibacillus sp. BIHB 4019]